MEIRLSVELANLIGTMKSHGMSDEEILDYRRAAGANSLETKDNPLMEVSVDYLRKALNYGYEIKKKLTKQEIEVANIVDNYEKYIGRAAIELHGGKLGTIMMFSENKQLVKINGNWHPVDGFGTTWGLLYTDEDLAKIEDAGIMNFWDDDFKESQWFNDIVQDAKNLYDDMTKMDNKAKGIYNAHKGEMIMPGRKEPVVPLKIKKQVAEMAKFCGPGTDLNKSDLLLLIDIALAAKDKEWFDELTTQLKVAK